MSNMLCSYNQMKIPYRYSTKPIEIICEYSNWQENTGNCETAWLSLHIQELLDNCLMELRGDFDCDSPCPGELTDILREIKILTSIFGKLIIEQGLNLYYYLHFA
jgi:hypothetical protein